MRVAVVGAAGYVGGELLRLLVGHPKVTDLVATSRSQAGKQWGDVHPRLRRLAGSRFSGLPPAEAARGADVILLALEHGESSKVMGDVIDAGPGLVVDLAADFRIKDGRLYQQYYGDRLAAALVHRFEYGLADIRGAELVGAKAIAAPGCFATASQLALYLLKDLDLATEPAVYGITGSSGAGVHLKPTTHHPARANNVFAYSVMGHRHESEIAEQWRRWTGRPEALPRLMAHSGPFVRGIYVTVHARLRQPVEAGLLERVCQGYRNRPFVQMVDRPPELTHVVGTNDALIHVAGSADGCEIAIMVAIDNLIKGAGGQALQAINLALGFEETLGLTTPPIFPI